MEDDYVMYSIFFSVAAVASQLLLDGIFAIEQRYIVFREAEHKM